MKKKFLLLIFACLAFFLIACEEKQTIEDEPKIIELLQDRTFRNGFLISPADNEPQPDNRFPLEYNLRYGTPTGNISWLVGQAGDRFGLADRYAFGDEVEYINNFYIIEDESKSIKVNPDESIIKLELNASKEYLSPRAPKEAWPHLLLQQGFSRTVSVSETESITLKMDLTLDKLDRMMTDQEYNKDLHAAQFLMYIVVRSNKAEDAGEFMWFGIPFLDSRYLTLPEAGMIDAGTAGNTGKFIYQMEGSHLLPNGLPVGEKQSININLIPYFERAINLAHTFQKMMSSSVEDLYLTNMNIGFELPGTFDIAVTIENFSVEAVLK
ncbi:MAG TPA: hypothetical protein VK005_02115 [Acholeplasma sp.]|nr:hypothetical protein [Acholeplasma sp.]